MEGALNWNCYCSSSAQSASRPPTLNSLSRRSRTNADLTLRVATLNYCQCGSESFYKPVVARNDSGYFTHLRRVGRRSATERGVMEDAFRPITRSFCHRPETTIFHRVCRSSQSRHSPCRTRALHRVLRVIPSTLWSAESCFRLFQSRSS